MKISIERGTLLKAVGQAQSVVERRNTIPILANVLIEAEGYNVHFRATDLDIEVVDKAPAKVERAGATTVSAVTLHEIVRKLPDGALVTLTALEIVLGVDNIIFLSVIASRLPEHQRARARRLGLLLAMGLRVLLLLTITWIMGMTRPLFTLFDDPVTTRDLILIAGGLFLLAKATFEIHERLEGAEHGGSRAGRTATWRHRAGNCRAVRALWPQAGPRLPGRQL